MLFQKGERRKLSSSFLEKFYKITTIIFGVIILLFFTSFLFLQITMGGSLTPSENPGPSYYTLEDIYTKLTTNATTTADNHDVTPSASPTSTFYTLTQVYDAIPIINAGTVLQGTNYLGVSGTAYGDTDAANVLTVANVAGTYDVTSLATDVVKDGTSFGTSSVGTLTPDGGTATVSDLFASTTAYLTADWILDTGTLTKACAITGFDGTANLVGDSYDGDGDGTNRWCITDAATARADQILTGQSAWVDGELLSGTYDIDNLTESVVKDGTSFGTSSVGTLTPDGGTAIVNDLFTGTTAYLTADWSLDIGTLTKACAISTFDATGNLVTDSYDGDGNGTNRWCITDAATATSSQILTGQSAWVDGVLLSGSMANIGTQTITPSTTNTTITEGYHDGSGVCVGDADLLATNIKAGVDLFGVVGTFDVDLPACSFGGTNGDVYAKNENCTWNERCQVGTACTDSCTITLTTYNLTTVSGVYSAECGVTLGGSSACDLCVIK